MTDATILQSLYAVGLRMEWYEARGHTDHTSYEKLLPAYRDLIGEAVRRGLAVRPSAEVVSGDNPGGKRDE